MNRITDSDQAVQAKYEIECALLAGAQWRLFDGAEPIATLTREEFELSVEWGKLIFAWWDGSRAQNFRVNSYQIERSTLTMQVTRGMERQTSSLILRADEGAPEEQARPNLSRPERRKDYAAHLAQLLVSNLSGVRVQRTTVGPDRSHSVPGRYARLSLRVSGERVLAIGVSEAEPQADIDGVIAAGLIWLASCNEGSSRTQRAQRIWFCLPRGRSEMAEMAETARERLTLLDVSHLGARIECFEVDERREALAPSLPTAQADLLSAHPRELSWPVGAPIRDEWRERILSLAPEVIEARPLTGCVGEGFSIHGLEFARVLTGEHPRVNFGLTDLTEKIDEDSKGALRTLSESNFNELKQLVRQIIERRTHKTADRRHPLYRLRAEAWLESLLRRRMTDLDLTLDERYVYSQIPAWRANERSVIDLLTINHQGRLVVIEIKAAEDPQLPLQGLDYWLRVEQARALGEFERRGLFAGARLADQSPLLYLAAPRLRFHRTFALIARCLAPQIEAYQIGLNTNWRSGVRVHSKERLNPID